MNKKISLILIAPLSLSLSSCLFRQLEEADFLSSTASIYELYDIDPLETYDLTNLKVGEIDIKYLQEQEYIPYISLEDYLSLLPFTDEYKYEVYNTFRGETFYIGKLGEDGKISEYNYVGIINTANKVVSTRGGFSSAMKYQEDTSFLDEGIIDERYRYVRTGDYSRYYFGDHDIKIYQNNGTIYYPLMFLNASFDGDSGFDVIYDMDKIFVFKDYSDATCLKYIENEQTCSVSSGTEKFAINHQDDVMPIYLREFNRNVFCYIMDNFYGLKITRNLSSMTKYYKISGLYDKFVDENAEIRGKAYSNALNKLEDDHTGISASIFESVWSETVDNTRGETSIARNTARGELKAYRDLAYSNSGLTTDDIRYSNDDKTAVIIYDDFSRVGINNLVARLNIVKLRGGIENVILDISTNGGGYIGILTKTLALLSDNGYYRLTFLEDSSNAVINYTGFFDSNKNGEIDPDDYFGDDFNFYLLTSKCSFSCGNAFPCYARLYDYATIIGETSGGGECSVATHLLPNMFMCQHSSNLHLGYYVDYTFVGFESGAAIHNQINYEDFYDLEKITTTIINN